MLVTPIKTHKIEKNEDLLEIIEKYVLNDKRLSHGPETKSKGIKDKSEKIINKEFHLSSLIPHPSPNGVILAVTSKIISICEGRVVSKDSISKDELVKKESQYYLPSLSSRFGVSFAITNNILAANAGIDESNADGNYILWPSNPQKTANEIREYVVNKLGIQNIGVIITDSKTTPLRWGVTAMALAHSGFLALKDYVGQMDLYGRKFVFEKLNIADSLAAASGLVMGEGAEQTPMAIISDLPNIEFVKRNPTEKELNALKISIEDDLYAPLVTSVKWKKGKK